MKSNSVYLFPGNKQAIWCSFPVYAFLEVHSLSDIFIIMLKASVRKTLLKKLKKIEIYISSK